MAVNNYIGWPSNVNRIILDSTTITLGDNAMKVDELSNGQRRSMLRGAFCPDKYSVTMDFDWVTEGNDGLTEIQRFYEWYKYRHKYGTIPFEFPKIIYSHETGVVSSSYGSKVEYYKITSAVEAKKYGTCQRVTMTWETAYGGVVSVIPVPSTLLSLELRSKYLEITMSLGSEQPVHEDFIVKINNQNLTRYGFYFDGTSRARFYFEEEMTGAYQAYVKYGDKELRAEGGA